MIRRRLEQHQHQRRQLYATDEGSTQNRGPICYCALLDAERFKNQDSSVRIDMVVTKDMYVSRLE
jgi:hypothetical protein